MAAMGYTIVCLFFALKGQQMVEKDNDDNEFYVLSIENVQLMLWTLFKCVDSFNMAANIQDGRHRLSCNVIVLLHGNGQSEKYCFSHKRDICACRK